MLAPHHSLLLVSLSICARRVKPSTGAIVYLVVESRPDGTTHRLAVSTDNGGHMAVMQHTFVGRAAAQEQEASSSSASPSSLSVLSFNIWHNQPPR